MWRISHKRIWSLGTPLSFGRRFFKYLSFQKFCSIGRLGETTPDLLFYIIHWMWECVCLHTRYNPYYIKYLFISGRGDHFKDPRYRAPYNVIRVVHYLWSKWNSGDGDSFSVSLTTRRNLKFLLYVKSYDEIGKDNWGHW